MVLSDPVAHYFSAKRRLAHLPGACRRDFVCEIAAMGSPPGGRKPLYFARFRYRDTGQRPVRVNECIQRHRTTPGQDSK